jgi:type II secretory pathway pseudopilin PulG
LSSPQCANSSEALPAYLRGLGKGGGGWFFEESLWNAVYGVNSHVTRSHSSRGDAAAEAARQRWQQRMEEARRQREEARRQRDEQARQQRRQQQYQRARQQRSGEQQAPADLAAAVPDVSNMSEEQLEAFLRAVNISSQPSCMLALFFCLNSLELQLMHLESLSTCECTRAATAGVRWLS